MVVATQTLHFAKLYGLERAVDMIIDAGFKAIDVSMCDLNAIPFVGDYVSAAKKLRAHAEERGARFVQAHAPFVGGNYDRYMKESVPNIPRAIEFASLLGIDNIVVHPIQKGRYYGNEEKLFSMTLEFYRSLAPLAHKYGVKIAIENMWQRHPIAGNICDDTLAPAEELIRMYDELADPEAFTVCLDIGHAALCGREPEDLIRMIGGERLGCIHAHDVDYKSDLHTLPGVSKIKWLNVCRALADIDYRGPFTLEADNFLLGFDEDQLPVAARFMSDIAHSWAAKIEEFKKNN